MTSTPDSTPNDNTTLTEVLDSYAAAGATGRFTPVSGALIECGSCGSALEASRFSILSLRRLEGASDPDDMISVVVTRCPVCGAEGTLVLGYGPTASPEDQDVQLSLADRRSDPQRPGDAAPSDLPDGA